MKETKRFSTRFAVILAIATLAGASAFADSRHPKTTKTRDEARASIVVRGERVAPPAAVAAPAPASRGRAKAERPAVQPRVRAEVARPVVQPNRGDRVRAGEVTADRTVSRGGERSYQLRDKPEKGRGRGQVDRNPRGGRGRDDDRYQQPRGGRGHDDRYQQPRSGNHGKRAPHYTEGRITRVNPYANGYRVWIAGAPHPYFVPHAYWRPGYFNIGMTIRLGGYYNTHGWYDYYGDYESSLIAERRMRGVVERVDYFRNEILLDVVGGGFVTILVRDPFEHVHPGDYVVVYGNWNRWGRFVAVDVDVIDRAYRW
ncbi:MAG: hypothetical protein HYU52_01625 [Acidobacteria bacterium]|nr:hypothetical protein [Acidobacteriota bacterium]